MSEEPQEARRSPIAVVAPHIDFRVGGKIFATLQPGLKKGMVSLSPDEQARFIEDAPKMCFDGRFVDNGDNGGPKGG